MAEEGKAAVTRGKRGVWIAISLAVIALITIFLFWSRPWQSVVGDGSARPLRVGYQTSPAMALIMVADDKRMFQRVGVAVDLKEFTAGKFALQAFLGGSLDVAVAGDMPTGLALLQGQKLTAFAEVIRDSRDEMRMVVRRDGPCNPSSPAGYFLAGAPRRIATSLGGGPEYFTVTFLRQAGVPLSHVTIVSQAPQDMAAAVSRGSVDGVAIFDPAAAASERLLGNSGCTFPDPQVYRQHYIAVARPEALDGRVDGRLVRFVQALRLAEGFIKAHPDEAKAIVQRRTAMDSDTLDALWPRFDFGVSLDANLPRLWMQEEDFHRLKPDARFPTPGPDFRKALSDKALR